MRTRKRVAALLIGVGAMHSGLSHAERSPVQGDPTQTLPSIAPSKPAQSNVTVRVERPDAAMQNLLAARLTPRHFKIEGAKTLPFERIASRFAPLANREITVAELLQAAESVTQMYKDAGYPLSFAFVPAQSFENGDVLITVVEGYVANVTVSGTPGPAEGRLRKIAQQLMRDRPLRQESFEHYVNVLSQQPGMQINATVQPPTTTDGACEMVLETTRKPFTFGTGVEWMSPGLRAIATATTNSLTPLGEQLSFTTLFPKGHNDEEYYAANYAQPIGTEGMLAKLTASHYRGVPENTALAPIGFDSHYVNDSKRLGGALSYPVILNNRHALTLTGGFYANNQFERYTQAVPPGAGRQIELATNVRVASAEAAYLQRGQGFTRNATLGLYKGFDAFGASRENNINDLNFFRTRLLVSQANDLPFGFGTSISAAGQYSGNRLASSEQISFGSRFFGLGYPAGEVAGDKGWGASAEINRMFAVDYAYLKALQPFIVTDYARVFSNSVSLSHRTLQSVGIGLRFSDRRYYTMDISVAQPVGDKPTNASHRSPRFNLLWSYQFD